MKSYYEQMLRDFGNLVDRGLLLSEEILADHCSFKIGGPADCFAMPEKQHEMVNLLKFALNNSIPYFILGKGSNLLIGDKGFRGLVISTEKLKKLSRDENFISAYCGVTLRELCEYALQFSLSGLEFASGIPGTVGGAVFMNAGAYGGEIKDVLYCSKYLSPNIDSLSAKDPIKHLKDEQHNFGYRLSVFQSSNFIHMSSVFRLQYADPVDIREKMDDLEHQRNHKQPMDLPSGGSVFRRPDGYFTGKLIDDCGLRGYKLGGAAISEKHCGFIVNLGGATAKNVFDLINITIQTVKDRFGVVLVPELRMVGEF